MSANGSLALILRAAGKTLYLSLRVVGRVLLGRFSAQRADVYLERWARELLDLARVKLEVCGQEHVPQAACLVMSNHQSYYDIPVLYAALPSAVRLRMVAKQELFYVPLWGRAMRVSGFIPIVRTNLQRAIASLNYAKAQMAQGTYIWLAPEGTRSRTGQLLPLKKGGFILAHETETSILPVCIEGSAEVMPPSGWRLYCDKSVRVTFFAPIATKNRAIEEVMSDVRAAITPHAAV